MTPPEEPAANVQSNVPSVYSCVHDPRVSESSSKVSVHGKVLTVSEDLLAARGIVMPGDIDSSFFIIFVSRSFTSKPSN